MMANAVEIQVQDGNLSRISQTWKEILALTELIWIAVNTDLVPNDGHSC